MRRLAEAVVSTEGVAQFKAAFYLDEERRPQVRIEVSANLQLRCQASLETYSHQVERCSELAVVGNEAEYSMLAEGVEAVEVAHGRLAIQQLVEDELLLGLPQVPRRPGLETVSFSTGKQAPGAEEAPGLEAESAPRQKPFAQLGEMLSGSGGKNKAGTAEPDPEGD
jgi:uncharacterized protein